MKKILIIISLFTATVVKAQKDTIALEVGIQVVNAYSGVSLKVNKSNNSLQFITDVNRNSLRYLRYFKDFYGYGGVTNGIFTNTLNKTTILSLGLGTDIALDDKWRANLEIGLSSQTSMYVNVGVGLHYCLFGRSKTIYKLTEDNNTIKY